MYVFNAFFSCFKTSKSNNVSNVYNNVMQLHYLELGYFTLIS